MKAYKVFNEDWTCRGFQYEVGKTYEMVESPVLCSKGFHACIKAVDCFNYYNFDPRNKVAEVELLGAIVGNNEDKQATNKIKVIREVKWEELLTLVNTGSGNSGKRNSGDSNSGKRNSGDSNSGKRNSGDSNSGDWNSGDFNSGDSNSGNRNSGDFNSGDSNSGDFNSGDFNSGDWNSGDWNSGILNTTTPTMRMFNKDTGINRGDIHIPSFMYFDLTQWVSHDTATDEERETYKDEIEICGGFLKTLEYKKAFKRAWSNASKEDQDKVKNLPNFDADIFYEISGIRL